MFDFSTTEATTSKEYLKPGQYKVSIQGTVYTSNEGRKKQNGDQYPPTIDVTFGNEQGQLMERFFVTEKAMGRIQSLHLSWLGTKLEKKFNSESEVGAYFEKVFNHEKATKIVKSIVVSGYQAPNGVVYGRLPFTNFVIPDNIPYEEGAFKEGSLEWNRYVEKAKPTEASNSNAMSLPESNISNSDESDGLPF